MAVSLSISLDVHTSDRALALTGQVHQPNPGGIAGRHVLRIGQAKLTSAAAAHYSATAAPDLLRLLLPRRHQVPEQNACGFTVHHRPEKPQQIRGEHRRPAELLDEERAAEAQ